MRKPESLRRKFGVKAKNAGVTGEEGWRAGACFRLEWHYCSLKGRKEPGQRKPSKIQGREETVVEPGLGDRLTGACKRRAKSFQNDTSLLPEKPSGVIPEIPRQLPRTQPASFQARRCWLSKAEASETMRGGVSLFYCPERKTWNLALQDSGSVQCKSPVAPVTAVASCKAHQSPLF